LASAPSAPALGARRHARGYTLAELLISLALTAALMTALGTAYCASITSYSENREMVDSVSQARAALGHLANAVRNAQAVQVEEEYGLVIVTTHDGEVWYYQWVTDDGLNHFTCSIPELEQTATLATNVTALDITCETEEDPETEETYTSLLRLDITVMKGANTFSLSRSVVPRHHAPL
jgi:Tfp pilus assembly protein PilE